MKKLNLSVTIIAFNESNNIARAINSVNSFADEVIVVDSNSSDNTVEIARSLGAKVVLQPFLGFGQQKNFAASLCRNSWILNIDADEEVSEQLKQNILKIDFNSPPLPILYQISRLNFFCGKAIRYGGWSPDWQSRLYCLKYYHWTTPCVHEELQLQDTPYVHDIHEHAQVKMLEGKLLHYTFQTFKSQIDTNLRYAILGAKELLNSKKRRPFVSEIIFRPLGKFIECYFIKLGILDGLYGLIIAINAGYSLFVKYAQAYFIYNSEQEK